MLDRGDDAKQYSCILLIVPMLILALPAVLRLTRLRSMDAVLLHPGISQQYQIALFVTWSVGRLAWPMSLVSIANGIDGSNLPSAFPPNGVEGASWIRHLRKASCE